MIRPYLIVVAALLLPCVTANRLRADALETEVRALAEDVKKLLDGHDESTVAVGQFVGPPGLPSSAGPAFARLLREELERLKVTVARRAKITIEGRYRLVEDIASRLGAVELEVKVVDKDGREMAGLKLKPRGIFGDGAVSNILGLTVQLPPGGTDRERDKKIRDGYEKPETKIDPVKTVVRAGADSPFAVEVLVKQGKDYVARPAEDKEGLAFVNIARDEVYGVRIINDADHEVAVTLTVDGLNLFTFSKLRGKDHKPLYSRFLVARKSSVLIKGWHRDNTESEEFLVTEYSKSAAAEVGSTANLGTITASFAAAWPKDGTPPPDEPVKPTERAKSADATARGAKVEAKWKEEQRLFGVTRAAVSVRYTK